MNGSGDCERDLSEDMWVLGAEGWHGAASLVPRGIRPAVAVGSKLNPSDDATTRRSCEGANQL